MVHRNNDCGVSLGCYNRELLVPTITVMSLDYQRWPFLLAFRVCTFLLLNGWKARTSSCVNKQNQFHIVPNRPGCLGLARGGQTSPGLRTSMIAWDVGNAALVSRAD